MEHDFNLDHDKILTLDATKETLSNSEVWSGDGSVARQCLAGFKPAGNAFRGTPQPVLNSAPLGLWQRAAE